MRLTIKIYESNLFQTRGKSFCGVGQLTRGFVRGCIVLALLILLGGFFLYLCLGMGDNKLKSIFRKKRVKVRLNKPIKGDDPNFKIKHEAYDERPYRVAAGLFWIGLIIFLAIWIIQMI